MEDKTENNGRKCVQCRYFYRYYTKGVHRFERTDFGLCRRRQNIVIKNDGCGCWEFNGRRQYLSKRAAKSMLYEILEELSAVRQIMQEFQDEGEEA